MQRWFNRTLALAASLGLVLMFSGTALAQYTVNPTGFKRDRPWKTH